MPQGDGFDRAHGTGAPKQEPLGPASQPAPKDEPEWRPHPTDKRFEVNAKGHLRTRVDWHGDPLP